MIDEELQNFKKIHLPSFCESLGFQIDKEKTSQKNIVMKKENDKIILKENENDDWIYFSIHSEKDNGTIIDFCQKRLEPNLGKIRKMLREFSGSNFAKNEFVQKKEISKTSRPAIEKIKWVWGQIQSDFFIEKYRGIDFEILNSAIAENKIKYKNDFVYVKLFEKNNEKISFCGITKTNIKTNEKRLIGGSKKGVAVFGDLQTAQNILIVESWIDGLSFLILNPETQKNTLILSVEGSFQIEVLTEILISIFEKDNQKKLFIGFDNDETGEKMYKIVNDMKEAFFGEIETKRLKPTTKDFNDDLKESLKNRLKIETQKTVGVKL